MAPNQFKPFVVSFGGEDLLLDRDMDKAKTWAGRSYRVLNGETVDGDQIVSVCETYSEDSRTVIVDNAHKVRDNKALREYIENRSVGDKSVILVAIVRSEKLPEMWSLAVSKGKGLERKKLKPWDESGHLTWIKLETDRCRVSIEDVVAKQLLQLVGTDFYRLANEIRKLSLYVGPAGRIQKEHILLVTTPTPRAEPWQVAEHVISKDLRKALSMFSLLYKNEGEDCLLPVVRSMMKQVEKSAVIRSLLDKGVADADIAVTVGMKEWPFKNMAAPNARKHELKSLVQYMGRLCKLDADVKGPALSKRTLVELTMLSIAQ